MMLISLWDCNQAVQEVHNGLASLLQDLGPEVLGNLCYSTPILVTSTASLYWDLSRKRLLDELQ
jgi:hypothetical protein